jgi:hypothetical protein
MKKIFISVLLLTLCACATNPINCWDRMINPMGRTPTDIVPSSIYIIYHPGNPDAVVHFQERFGKNTINGKCNATGQEAFDFYRQSLPRK